MKAITLFFLLFPSAILAQLPDAPKAKVQMPEQPPRRVFIVGTALLAASQTADAMSTRRILDSGGWENNPIYGRHPGAAKQSLINGAFFGAEMLLFRKTERSGKWYVRWGGRAFIAFEIEEHIRLTACNSGINVHSARIQNCQGAIHFF